MTDLVSERKAIYEWARGDAILLSARCAKAEEALRTLRSAWNAHMETCPKHAALELPRYRISSEDLEAWRDAPSGTASASKCPHGVTFGVYCRECDYDEAMAVDTDDE